MEYAQNVNGFPIFSAPDATGHQSRLWFDRANNRVLEIRGAIQTVIAIDAAGNPQDGAGVAIPQPPMADLMQVMLEDALQARMRTGRLLNPTRRHAAPVANFGLTPARVNTTPLDYTMKEHQVLYKEATKSLYRDSEPAFDLTTDRLHGFLGKVATRAQVSGWNLAIVIDLTTGDTRSLIQHYGEVTLEDVQAQVATFDMTQTLMAQHDQQIHACIMASLNQAALDLVALKIRKYLAPSGENSGLLLLRLVITESTLETKSTTNHLWAKLTAGMPEIMAGHGNNIVDFNNSVRAIQATLRARGQDPDFILPQLFAVYSTCEGGDSPFGRFIEFLENSYNNGVDMDSEALMNKAEEKYEELTERHLMKTVKKNDEIVALKAQIEELVANSKKDKGTDREPGNGGGNRRKQTAWMFLKPKEGEATTKKVNEKDYHWCDGKNGSHKPKWVRHHPKDCGKNPPKTDTSTKTTDEADEKKDESAKKVAWSAAMLSTFDSDE